MLDEGGWPASGQRPAPARDARPGACRSGASGAAGAVVIMAAALMTLHIAANAEGLAAAWERALEGLLASV